MDLDTADLRLMVAIVEAGSLTRAAARLEQSLNVVSRRLARLEAATGVRLVDRTTRRLSVTEAGERLYRRALVALEHVDLAVAELGDTQGEPAGTVRVVLPSSAVTPSFLARLRVLLAGHPRLTVRLLVTSHVAPLAGDVDLALVVGDVPDRAGLIARRVATIRWSLCAAPAYVDARGLPRTPARLLDHDCLRFRDQGSQDTWTLEGPNGEHVTVPVRGSFESDDSRILADATYAGLGIGIRPRDELQRAISDGRLVAVLPRWNFGATRVSLVSPPGRGRLPGVRTVGDALAEAIASLE